MPNGPIIVDTNLLALLVVGLTSEDYIDRHKRLKKYAVNGFRVLQQLLSTASEIIVTPHILAETSNLLRYIDDPYRTIICKTFRGLVSNVREERIVSAEAVFHADFIRLGLTDAVILDALKTTRRLATDDLDLYLSASRLGYDAINFSHLLEASYE